MHMRACANCGVTELGAHSKDHKHFKLVSASDWPRQYMLQAMEAYPLLAPVSFARGRSVSGGLLITVIMACFRMLVSWLAWHKY
mgnify:CR=1 FL=1